MLEGKESQGNPMEGEFAFKNSGQGGVGRLLNCKARG